MLKTCARERGRPCRRRKNFCSKWTTCIEATWGLCCARTNMEYSSSCVGELWLIPTSGHRAYTFAYEPLRPLVEGSRRALRLHGAQAALAGSATARKGSGSDRVKELANLDAEQSCNLGFE